ncbi:MAG: mannose-6-phosphate isomerase [Bacteroidales bacterium]|nr:mannose-6-phosphate isomerase [Bacteroidales bacterium]
MLPVIKFEPVFKSVLWGGTRIAEFKGLPSQGDHVGESWELSPMEGHESVVADGPFKGKTLPELLREYGREIMGERLLERYGDRFPLLIKFIDSTQDLSIQVHPDDKLAAERHNSLGKTEMWYSVLPTPTAYLYAGFNQEMDADKFRAKVADSTIVDTLTKYYTKPGDLFFLPAGRVHAIGEGNFVLEIQEASDITYRIYDYNRRDAQGNLRQLHVDESVDAINYNDKTQEVKNVTANPGEQALLEDCSYFTTTLVNVDGEYFLPLAKRGSFTVLIATKGNLTVVDSEGRQTTLPQGQTVLVPAEVPAVTLKGTGEVVTVYIK